MLFSKSSSDGSSPRKEVNDKFLVYSNCFCGLLSAKLVFHNFSDSEPLSIHIFGSASCLFVSRSSEFINQPLRLLLEISRASRNREMHDEETHQASHATIE